ncbi:hypothetical protein THASP1DRAFT_23365 [Thamnocephalis sphaerospora]|uniref:Uncharacterized protein n=1 Tax=Thamnocephalis sphaerospora TaxID=78915 RepID=A0A4P9XT48_9FUNG|nr:hypothetical protein THASP1DRAFT_23365 [Thamnocephalis sphaerospora]|eukprot:RKP08701.1 hypothetical protein THASP1DRAFT_23365 [Thamnocephalis sphaerospora]
MSRHVQPPIPKRRAAFTVFADPAADQDDDTTTAAATASENNAPAMRRPLQVMQARCENRPPPVHVAQKRAPLREHSTRSEHASGKAKPLVARVALGEKNANASVSTTSKRKRTTVKTTAMVKTSSSTVVTASVAVSRQASLNDENAMVPRSGGVRGARPLAPARVDRPSVAATIRPEAAARRPRPLGTRPQAGPTTHARIVASNANLARQPVASTQASKHATLARRHLVDPDKENYDAARGVYTSQQHNKSKSTAPPRTKGKQAARPPPSLRQWPVFPLADVTEAYTNYVDPMIVNDGTPTHSQMHRIVRMPPMLHESPASTSRPMRRPLARIDVPARVRLVERLAQVVATPEHSCYAGTCYSVATLHFARDNAVANDCIAGVTTVSSLGSTRAAASQPGCNHSHAAATLAAASLSALFSSCLAGPHKRILLTLLFLAL